MSFLVKEINPDSVTWPACSFKISVAFSGLHENAINSLRLRCFEGLTISIDEVVISNLDVRVKDGGHVSSSSLNFSIHLSEVCGCEVLWVEFKVFIAIRLAILVSPLDVHDEDINRELIISEVSVALHDNLSRSLIILGEVETKGMERRQRDKASHSGESVSNSLVSIQVALSSLNRAAEKEEFESSSLRDEVDGRSFLIIVGSIVKEYPSVS